MAKTCKHESSSRSPTGCWCEVLVLGISSSPAAHYMPLLLWEGIGSTWGGIYYIYNLYNQSFLAIGDSYPPQNLLTRMWLQLLQAGVDKFSPIMTCAFFAIEHIRKVQTTALPPANLINKLTRINCLTQVDGDKLTKLKGDGWSKWKRSNKS